MFLRDWPEVRKSEKTIWILFNIWRLEQFRNTKFDMIFWGKKFLNAAKFHISNFYHFWVSKGKPTMGVKLPTSIQIRFNIMSQLLKIYFLRFFVFGNLIEKFPKITAVKGFTLKSEKTTMILKSVWKIRYTTRFC